MNRPSGSFSRARRLSALLGVLLHLLGAAALPSLHAWSLGAAVERSARDTAPGERKDQNAPPHDDQHCVLCHAFGSAAMAADGPEIPVSEAGERVELTPAPTFPAPRLARDARARAPPVLS
ncbi:DUF2946 family protein [Longimicrobium terrae]|uniref:DUF2946 domain-containing protein n=1 Tax=Longimicrobium terrae TaxID=1639882 RepID=A0A841GIC6_9BACT|nr:DUF2946 family protein [Longimicrobium terrae]MBB4634719.1 hypothetical protein [Longimicrobium terrae]MBB6068391.1 hypothetical protein [Longimicrobium terrae]NNC32671.1 DUF2946 family protein [Longimicrobium terrae]